MPQLSYLDDHDSSSAFAYCVKANELEVAVKLAYYGAKLFRVIKTLPVPPPAV